MKMPRNAMSQELDFITPVDHNEIMKFVKNQDAVGLEDFINGN
jgi:hypothetical protein